MCTSSLIGRTHNGIYTYKEDDGLGNKERLHEVWEQTLTATRYYTMVGLGIFLRLDSYGIETLM